MAGAAGKGKVKRRAGAGGLPPHRRDEIEPRSGKGKTAAEAVVLGHASSPRSERRFQPKASAGAIASVIAASLAVVALGAGTYAEWIHPEKAGPHRFAPHAPYILGAGAAVLLAVLLFGVRPAVPIRVGDAGLAVERGLGELERIAWHEVTGILHTGDFLTFQSSGRSIAIPLPVHHEAAARALSEARRRIPARASEVDASIPGDDDAGESIALEPPQVAGKRCTRTDKPISFERDARLCGRCGALYHKDGVPWRCAVCDAKLRA